MCSLLHLLVWFYVRFLCFAQSIKNREKKIRTNCLNSEPKNSFCLIKTCSIFVFFFFFYYIVRSATVKGVPKILFPSILKPGQWCCRRRLKSITHVLHKQSSKTLSGSCEDRAIVFATIAFSVTIHGGNGFPTFYLHQSCTLAIFGPAYRSITRICYLKHLRKRLSRR